jgi:hypothetical protein
MRDDLLDAYAAVDWARAEIPTLEQKFRSWMEAPPYLLVEDPHPETGKKLFKLEINRRLPGTINAAVGAIINSARTSLDLLAASIAKRNGKTPNRNTHFPIYDSVARFNTPESVTKRKKWLSAIDLKILEELKPYRRGNALLFALHQLDILRKHERLISVHLMPQAVHVDPLAYSEGLKFASPWPGFKDGAVIAWTDIDSTHSKFQIPAEVAFNEADLVLNYPVIATLRQFTGLANSIIQLFDVLLDSVHSETNMPSTFSQQAVSLVAKWRQTQIIVKH